MKKKKKKLPGEFPAPHSDLLRVPYQSYAAHLDLGMANSDGDQDMIVYAFSRTGGSNIAN